MTNVTTTARPATYADLIAQAAALCAAQPGYGTPAYRGDPAPAFALQQEAARMVDDMARRLVSQDVRYCVSGLITALVEHMGDHPGSIIDEDDAMRLAYRQPDAADYGDAIDSNDSFTIAIEKDGDDWTWQVIDKDDGEVLDSGTADSECAAYEAAFDSAGNDKPDGGEIFEHWLVTDDLARRLKAQGESVADDIAGLTVWGRATTGQAIYADAVFQTIARDILEA